MKLHLTRFPVLSSEIFFHVLIDVWMILIDRCTRCFACHPCWCHQNTTAGGGTRWSDDLFWSDRLLQEDLKRGRLPSIMEGSRRYTHTNTSHRFHYSHVHIHSRSSLRLLCSSRVPFIPSVRCDLGDIWAPAAMVLRWLRRTVSVDHVKHTLYCLKVGNVK